MAETERQLSTQEINSLRKSGKLEEALRHARHLHNGNAGDSWVTRTLFWCLYDEFKRARSAHDSDALSALTKEVGALELPSGENDQLMHDCASRILGTNPIANASQLSKAGNHHEAVALLRPLARAEDAAVEVGEAYAWVLYRKLKDDGAEQPEVAYWCLNEFSCMWSPDWCPNSILLKCMLIQAKIHAEGWSGLVSLVETLGLHRMAAAEFADDRKDSDFEPFQDQLLSALHKCLKKHPGLHGKRPQLHRLLEAWKESFGDSEWPQYHLGRILLWTGGDRDQARSLLLKTVQRNPGDFWRWQAFAESLEGDEAKAALSRGILCRCDDGSFKIPLYKEYSDHLAAEGEIPAATASLKEAMRLRQLSGNDWREPLPAWFDQTAGHDAVDIHHYAEPYAARADQLLAADLPWRLCLLIRPLHKEGRYLYLCSDSATRTLKFQQGHSPPTKAAAIEAQFEDKDGGVCIVLAWREAEVPMDLGTKEIGIVGHVNTEKRLVSVTTPDQDFIPLYFDRWPDISHLRKGAFVGLLLFNQKDGKPLILSWMPVDPELIPGFAIPIRGRFERARDQTFGFIEMDGQKIFVAPEEARNLGHSAEVCGWAVRSIDKHGRPSWKLLPPI